MWTLALPKTCNSNMTSIQTAIILLPRLNIKFEQIVNVYLLEGSVVFFSPIAALVVMSQALIGHWVEAKSAMQLPEPQSHSLAVPSLDTAVSKVHIMHASWSHF